MTELDLVERFPPIAALSEPSSVHRVTYVWITNDGLLDVRSHFGGESVKS